MSRYKDFRKRLAVRAIIIDDENNIALAYVSKQDYYKIPGGGVDEGEDMIEALHRECLEEAGVKITDIQPLGFIRDINSIWQLTQESFCYAVKIKGQKKRPTYTKKERAKGYALQWVPLQKVISTMVSGKPKRDTEKHLKERDLLFVKEYLKNK